MRIAPTDGVARVEVPFSVFLADRVHARARQELAAGVQATRDESFGHGLALAIGGVGRAGRVAKPARHLERFPAQSSSTLMQFQGGSGRGAGEQ